MNQQERDELRAKHRVGQNEADNQCQSCYSPDGYPCDTIKVLDAWADTTEYPPEGKNEECAHTDDSGLCWCERGLPRCPKCRGWFGLLHAKKAILQIKVLDASEAEVHDGSEVSSTREVCDHADWTGNAYSDGIYVDMGYRYCPKCGNKLDNG